jgi:hypothetical protein
MQTTLTELKKENADIKKENVQLRHLVEEEKDNKKSDIIK